MRRITESTLRGNATHRVPLAFEFARIGTARIVLMLIVQAVVVASLRALRFPRASRANRLVVGNISGKPSDLRTDVQLLHCLGERLEVVVPAQPTAMGSIQVHNSLRGFACKLVNRVWDP